MQAPSIAIAVLTPHADRLQSCKLPLHLPRLHSQSYAWVQDVINHFLLHLNTWRQVNNNNRNNNNSSNNNNNNPCPNNRKETKSGENNTP